MAARGVESGFIVDGHAYLGHSLRFEEDPSSALEDLIESMNDSGVDQALVSDGGFTTGSPEDETGAENDRIAGAVAQYPERLLGVALVRPTPANTAIMLEEADRAVRDLGFVALRFVPSAFSEAANEESGSLLAELAGRLGTPLWIHTMEGPYSTPVLAANLAKRFPETNFVLAHRGYATGGLALYFVSKHPNLYMDMSSLVEWEIDYYLNFVNLSKLGLHKFLFGSSYPLGDAGTFLGGLKTSRLSTSEANAILGRNVLRLISRSQGGPEPVST